MRRGSAKDTRAKQAEAKKADPRLAAFARLLARDLANRHFQEELDQRSGKPYPAGIKRGDAAGELP